MSYYTNSRSPPPLQHPVPTHPAYIPEPPSTPVSPQGYQRYTSSPPKPQQQQQQQQQQHFSQPLSGQGIPPNYAVPSTQYQPMGVGGPSDRPPIPGQPHSYMNTAAAVAPVDFSSWGLNDATAQLGMQLGQSAVAAGHEYMQKNASARHRCSLIIFFPTDRLQSSSLEVLFPYPS